MLTAAAMAGVLFFLGILYALAHKGRVRRRDVAVSGASALVMTAIAVLWPDSSLQPSWDGTATVLRWLPIVGIFCAGCRLFLSKSWKQALICGFFGGTWLTVVFSFWIWS